MNQGKEENIPVTVLPVSLRPIFPYHVFNPMQSELFHQAYRTDENMVVAAPTGSGKTVIMELGISRLYELKRGKHFRCVYIAPNKALCQQRWSEWSKKFGTIGLSVLEVTGDIDYKDSLRTIAKATIIVTTPEKWDSLTRSWRDHVFLLGAVDLLLIDEAHHLAEDRGAVLEAVIVRMRIISRICMDQLSTFDHQSHQVTSDKQRR